jgi:hypothetical protein
MRKRFSFFTASILCSAAVASAGTITYEVSVDTTSFATTAGSLDFNINPGRWWPRPRSAEA